MCDSRQSCPSRDQWIERLPTPDSFLSHLRNSSAPEHRKAPSTGRWFEWLSQNIFETGSPIYPSLVGKICPQISYPNREEPPSGLSGGHSRRLPKPNDRHCRQPLLPGPATFSISLSSLPYGYRRIQPRIRKRFVREYRRSHVQATHKWI
jgi:hypothetical protein